MAQLKNQKWREPYENINERRMVLLMYKFVKELQVPDKGKADDEYA